MKPAVILIGGNSKRMGYEKSTINYHGVAQRDHMFTCLQKLGFDPWFAGKPEQIKNNLLPDTYNNIGPISGILSALTLCSSGSVLVVSCDQPMIDTDILEHLWQNSQNTEKHKLLTCFHKPDDNNLIEPFPSVWQHSAKLFVENAINNKSYAIQYIIPSDQIHTIPCVNYKKLVNINTPQQYKAVRKEYGLEF